MINVFLSLIAPHHCCECNKIGTLLCDNCKNNITTESIMSCIVCNCPTFQTCLCNTCSVSFNRIWVVGKREGTLQRLIGLYKFERAKSAFKNLGDLLLDVLPELPLNTVIVPVPTTPCRIRERGYDHMLLIARYLAKSRRLKCSQLIGRQTNTKQRQSTAKQRLEQAKKAFCLNGDVSADIPYLLVDDVYTTGATIKYTSEILRKAGVKHVWVAIIARQTLD